ncbi:MAG: site-specific DNA-methyltransferase [Bacteroidetes bacterium]|nr:site-specific DNA-methyltransferase [Bacteroidota bacterium]
MPTLQFKGKNIIWNHHLAVPFHTLDEVPELHYQPEKANLPDGKAGGNMIIEGDNLIALKALLPQFAGKVKCVCIDPPYNTGNDNGQGKGWIYNDNVSSPLLKEWFEQEVSIDDLTRHDKWLCMMSPRLKLIRDLLSEDGVIFISIDDNEIYNLRQLMNEIFGEENFIAILPTVMNLKGNNDQYAFSGTHEYTLVFAKDKNMSMFYQFELDEEENETWDEDEKGFFKKGSGLLATSEGKNREDRPYMYFPILIKNNKVELISFDEYKNVYYLCTGENLAAEDKINEADYYVGEYGKQAIYLVYKQDYETLTRLALNLTLAEKIKEQQPGKKPIVYAPSCFLVEEYLTDNQIEYVGIPYNLFQRREK